MATDNVHLKRRKQIITSNVNDSIVVQNGLNNRSKLLFFFFKSLQETRVIFSWLFELTILKIISKKIISIVN